MRKTREQKAITLIALIITIVVLLILAVVAINAVTRDGIIQHATNAKIEYEKAQDKENSTLSYYQTYLDAEGKVGKWIQTGEKIFRTNSDGITEQVQVIKKVDKEGNVQEIEIGDYVDYKANVEGYNDINGWRVLGVENGQILLVSSETIGEIRLNREELKNNMIENKINNICNIYAKGVGANGGRSIKVEDIDKLTGYNPRQTGNGLPYGNGLLREYNNKVEYSLNEDGYVEYTNINEGKTYTSANTKFTNIDGKSLTKGKRISITSNYYAYYLDTLTMEKDNPIKGVTPNSTVYDMIFGEYWLANIYIKAGEGEIVGGVKKVSGDRVLATEFWNSKETYSDDKLKEECGNLARAVVYLKSDIELTRQNENSWKINE